MTSIRKKNISRTTLERWIEQILWRAAAVVTLVLLVGLLLLSFEGLDRLDPEAMRTHAETGEAPDVALGPERQKARLK